jgi:hypothetical protein
MNWKLRLKQWRSAVAAAGNKASIPKMLKSLIDGIVPRTVWRQRMRTCARCPIYDPRGKVCKSPYPGEEHLGCGCFTPFSALTTEPYAGGCWGRAAFGGDFGWGAYHIPSRWARFLSIFRFLNRK